MPRIVCHRLDLCRQPIASRLGGFDRRDEFDASFNRTDLGGDHPTVDKDRSHGICPSHRARKNMRYVMR